VSNLPLSLSICRERKLMVETDTVRVVALRAKFGQGYDFYCRRVNRWWPRWTGFAGSIKDMRLNWRRVLVKEYNTTFVLRVALVTLALWSDHTIRGPGAWPGKQYLVAGALAWLALYLGVPTAKKMGLLTA
jgi:hypothetical protein